MHAVSTQCPACFEWVEIFVDQADEGTMVQDCDVCCRPMEATVWWGEMASRGYGWCRRTER